jgi:hypothetical protein
MDEGEGRGSSRWIGIAAIAAVVVSIVVAAVVLLTGDDADDGTAASSTSTTATTGATTTTGPGSTTTTELPAGVVVDPIEPDPLPPSRDAAPDTIVAIVEDGRLVTLDAATGAVLEELEWWGDLREVPEEGGRFGLWQVAVSADRATTWVSLCCEPAAGQIRLVGHDEPAVVLADNPQVTMSSRWLTAASYLAHIREMTGLGDPASHRAWSSEAIDGMTAAVLSPDGSRLVVEPWPERDTAGRVVGRRPLVVVETAVVRPVDEPDSPDEIVDDDPVELPSDRWTLPTFRRDGLLLVAEQGTDGSWRPRLVDLDTLEVTDAGFDYGDGVPVMQRYDGSGEWLLVLLVDDPDAFPQVGRLIWFGPEGRSGTIPGAFLSAAW